MAEKPVYKPKFPRGFFVINRAGQFVVNRANRFVLAIRPDQDWTKKFP